MTRKERQLRAEEKREIIRKELFGIMYKCTDLKNLDPVHTINTAIEIMIKRNPQEADLVRQVCNEICQDTIKWSKDMLEKYTKLTPLSMCELPFNNNTEAR